jgi:cytochrome d ubiquinol oxidase subunit II
VQTKIINIENQKFLHNLIAMPIVAGMIGIGALSLLWGIASTFWTKSERGIWFSGFGTISVVIGLVLILGYNHTAFYPSLADLQSSLTIENSSSSHYTLVTMSYVSLMVPFVLAYITWAWRVMNRDKITMDEVQDDAHHY